MRDSAERVMVAVSPTSVFIVSIRPAKSRIGCVASCRSPRSGANQIWQGFLILLGQRDGNHLGWHPRQGQLHPDRLQTRLLLDRLDTSQRTDPHPRRPFQSTS